MILQNNESDVLADLNYFPALGTPIPTSTWKKRFLGISDQHTRHMTIHDVRTTTRDFDLDTNGFRFIKLTSKPRVDKSSTEETIRQEYLPELEMLAKDL